MPGRPRGKPQIKLTVPMIRRIRELRKAQLSVEAVARVIELDFGEKPSEHTIRTYAPLGRAFNGRPSGLATVTHNNVENFG